MASQPQQRNKRSFLGIYFQCCSVYDRIYINKEKTAYKGTCPRCGKQVAVPIGKEGRSERFFVVT
ncbi:MAG: hypothetical protein JW795_11870 [Chitinivibrionales bacterium]|nr:hypothetical protein [Chitinivibrionales bacterium]